MASRPCDLGNLMRLLNPKGPVHDLLLCNCHAKFLRDFTSKFVACKLC